MSSVKKLLEIFRAGTFTSEEGQRLTFSAADVAATVAAYDPQKHKAPLVVGHPKTEDPAYGHAVSLSLSNNGVVLAEPANVDPAFAELVNAQRFDKISASFWSPTSPRNPVQGVYYLRHIGFLGAVPPAVTGLKSPSFADTDNELITINFSDTPKEHVMTAEEIAALKTLEQKLKADEASFADKKKEQDKKQAELDAKEKLIAQAESKVRTVEIESFAEGLIGKGKLLPIEKAGVVALLGSLPIDQSISFADGDGKTVNQPGAEVLRNLLENLPERVDFSERSATDKRNTETTSFAAPSGYSIDNSQSELHNKITAYAKQHNISYAAAVAAVGG